MKLITSESTPVSCKNCAQLLARIVCQRHWWFPLLRAPLVMGMRFLAWRHRIDTQRHQVRDPGCRGCIRFMKAELEEKSPTFRFLNDRIGERFSRLRNERLTQEELAEAKQFAIDNFKGSSHDDSSTR